MRGKGRNFLALIWDLCDGRFGLALFVTFLYYDQVNKWIRIEKPNERPAKR